MNGQAIDHLELLKNGQPFIDKTIEVIQRAEKFVMLHTYILNVDDVTEPIIAALEEKARQGIQVFLICDSVGSIKLTDSAIDRLTNGPIHFRFFQPLIHFRHIGRRLHQKVLLVDNKFVILGGINLSKNFNLPEGQNPWLDYACFVEGSEVRQVLSKILPIYRKLFQGHENFFYKLHQNNQHLITQRNKCIQTLVNDWMRYKNEIYRSYLVAIRNSKKSITLMATYFIPGKKILKELARASKRGVKVNLVFCSVSDHPMISKVEQYFYGWYLQNDFHIYEWSESVMHGKIALVDDYWVSIGSYNHNYISRYGNLEINFEITDKHFAEIIKSEFNHVISKCRKVDVSVYQTKYTLLDKSMNMIIYLLTNIITFISLTLVFRRHKDSEIV